MQSVRPAKRVAREKDTPPPPPGVESMTSDPPVSDVRQPPAPPPATESMQVDSRGSDATPDAAGAAGSSLAIVSFNYAGIQTNPFEYLDGSKKMEDCSTLMKGYVQERWGSVDLKTSKEFKAMSNLDKLHKGLSRYSICYKPLPYGLEETSFRDAWIQAANSDPTPILVDEKPVSKVNEDLINFDWDCYRSVTRNFTKEEVDALFQRCYVDPFQKRNATATFIKSITDANPVAVIIIQEFLQADIPKLKELLDPKLIIYARPELVQAGEVVSLIISHNIVGDQDDTFPNFNKETVAVRFGSYLVVGTHYPSKGEDIGSKQGHLNMHQALLAELAKPNNANFIVGVDANHTLPDPIGDPNLRHTSQKRRSFLQTQFGKAEQQVTAKIDYILQRGPLLLLQSKCVYDVTTMSEDYANLPHANMPYDHAVRVHYYDLASANASMAGAVFVAPGVSPPGVGDAGGDVNEEGEGGDMQTDTTGLGGGNRKSKRKRNRKTQRRRRKSNRKKNRR
jgi:hypothetical protein